MKSYTDIDQSKVLAEILPPESADMYWSRCTITDFGDGVSKVSYAVEPCNISQFRNTKEDVPCWSLAALLDYLKQHYYVRLDHDGISWSITCVEHNTGEECTSDSFDDPVDACWGMILRLNEKE